MTLKNRILRPLLRLTGRDVFSEYEFLKRAEYATIGENRRKQQALLERTLLHAWNYVPYYRPILEQAGVVRDGKINLANFSKIPPLTRAILTEKFAELTSTDPDYKKRKPFTNGTGGSTGEPVKFLQDSVSESKSNAGGWLFFSFITDFPSRHIKLWGSPKEATAFTKGAKAAIGNWLYNRKFLQAFDISKDDMQNYVTEINRFKPEIIDGYTNSLYELSRFIREHKLNVFSPKGIVAAAETVYPEMKKTISEVFRCPVLNRYGTREVGAIACSCAKDAGLHVNVLNVYFEILDKDMRPCTPGRVGRVYVTTLNNYSMPLIRYELGDIAVPATSENCPCGRGLPLVASVEGREVQAFMTRDGRIVPSEFFIHTVGATNYTSAISKYQFIQEDYDLVKIKVVVKDSAGFEKSKKSIEDALRKIMGENCKIGWEQVDSIPPLASGKYLYTISKLTSSRRD